MHKNSYNIMKRFEKKYLKKTKILSILDVGSYDVNGNYKKIFSNKKWKYKGLDMEKGPNVDIVSKNPYDFGLEEKFDVVISGNCLEHVGKPWIWIDEVYKATKKGGLVCIVTPFSLGMHRCPTAIDCWRILPDGYRNLLDEKKFRILESELVFENKFKITKRRFFKILPRKAQKRIKTAIKKISISDTYVVAIKK